MQVDLMAESVGEYIGARNQHSEIINQAVREREIHRDIAAEFEDMLQRDKAKAVERMALYADMWAEAFYLGWLLDQYGVHRELQGKHDNKASEGEETLAMGGITREETYCSVVRSSYAYHLHGAMADLFNDEITRLLGGVS